MLETKFQGFHGHNSVFCCDYELEYNQLQTLVLKFFKPKLVTPPQCEFCTLQFTCQLSQSLPDMTVFFTGVDVDHPASREEIPDVLKVISNNIKLHSSVMSMETNIHLPSIPY